MMYTNRGERDEEHENSGKDTSCTDMDRDSDTAPCVQACGGHRDLCSDDWGGLLLVYDLLLVIIRMSSKELWLQLLAVAGAMLVIPFIAGFLEGLLENAADAIKEFIES